VGRTTEQCEPATNVGSANTERIPHSRPTIAETDIRVVEEVLASGQLADTAQVASFERELSSYIGQRGGVATNSGTSALYLALLSLGQNGRDEVIVPSYACIALLNAVHAAALRPIIVDINDYDFNISFNAIKRAVTRKSKAIIACHMFGDPIRDIRDIASLHVPVIEDCALSVGARIDGRKVGSFTELSVFSFYATKMLATGHGGMVLSRSEDTLSTLRDFIWYDNRTEYGLSFNFRLTDFQAALGRSQLTRLDDFIARRRRIAAIYDEGFEQAGMVVVPPRPDESVYFRYILQVEDADTWIERMCDQGVECKKPVYRPLHQYAGLDVRDYPNAERAYMHNVSIPIYPALGEREIEHIIRMVRAC
jgi:perosamine synthetase